MPKSELLFLDTSIHIARLLHGPNQRARVNARIEQYLTASGLVTRQEFKRRVLKCAAKLLDVLEKRGGCEAAHAYFVRLVTNQFQKRAATICLGLLGQAEGLNDTQKTARLKVRLRTLIVTGLDKFDKALDLVSPESGCACGAHNVRELPAEGKKPKRFDFGPERCSDPRASECGISQFLSDCGQQRECLLQQLGAIPEDQKTKELKAAELFLQATDANLSNAPAHDPCLKVGDAVIALEASAAGASTFYTMNYKESEYLCRALGQTLIVRPADDMLDDTIHQNVSTRDAQPPAETVAPRMESDLQ